MKIKLAPEFDERKLIELVKNKPILWDKKHEYYGDRYQVFHAWKEVVLELELNPELYMEPVKEKWRGLRTTFVNRMYDMVKVKSESGSQSTNNKTVWRYYNRMSFLRDSVIHNREVDTNLVDCAEEVLTVSQDDDTKANDQIVDEENDIPQSSAPTPEPDTSSNNDQKTDIVTTNQSSQQDSSKLETSPTPKRMKRRHRHECDIMTSTLLQNEKEKLELLSDQIDMMKQQSTSKIPNKNDADDVPFMNLVSLVLPLIRKFSDVEKLEYYQGLLQFTKEFYQKTSCVEEVYTNDNE